MIPPWVRPESPETLRIIDDATLSFAPAFGRGQTQRGIFADPRWGLHRRYRGLRSDERAAIQNALLETRGQLNILRVTPHSPIRGSMPTSELLTNNTFANGTTGWTSGSEVALSVADRVLRLTRSAVTAAQDALAATAASTVVAYAPYVARAFVTGGRGTFNNFKVTVGSTQNGNEYGSTAYTGYGMLTHVAVPSATSAWAGLEDLLASGLIAGDYYQIPYLSFARGAQVDGGVNALLRSDEIDNGTWTQSGLSSVAANNRTAPDGTSTGDSLVENSSNTQHFVSQAVTVSSSVGDYCFGAALRIVGRNFAALQLIEGTGSTAAIAYFNLNTGVVGTTSVSTNWSNPRSYIVSLGNSWYACFLVARKTNAATSVTARVYPATADGIISYLGDGASGVSLWRATLAQSSVPMRLTQTTSAIAAGTAPTGSTMYTKGWPASTSGLLLAGDWFEWQGELKQLTQKVDSDAAGLAYMQFRPGLAGAPADNDPIVIQEPFGRFIYPQGVRELSNLFGVYSDCEMDLEEIYS